MRRLLLISAAVALLCVATVRSENSVVVESKSVPSGASGVAIGIKLTNDVPLGYIVIPLEMREVTPGAFVTAVKKSFGERLTQAGVLDGIRLAHQLADPNGSCKSGMPGGYLTITFANDQLNFNPVAAPPEGFLFVAGKVNPGDPALAPGTDVVGSALLTVNLTNTPGSFEIDTTCTAPKNHLIFVPDGATSGIVPTFTKGVIHIAEARAHFSASPRCGTSPLTVSFADSSRGTGGISSWHWNFGDGTTGSEQNPTHVFAAPGTYDISLIVSDGLAVDTLVRSGYIVVSDALLADFVGFPLSGHLPLTVLFEPTLTGAANGYFWDFGDGSTSALRNPIHTYTVPGAHDVKLCVFLDLDDCHRQDSILKSGYVVASTFKAEFTAQPVSGVIPLSVQFTDQTVGSPTGWYWDFGDGQTSIEPNPLHVYSTLNTFDVQLRVTDALGADSVLKLGYIRTDPLPYSDLVSNLYASALRPGFMFWLWPAWTNTGNLVADNCLLKVLLPPEVTLSGVYPGDIWAGSYSGWSLDHDTIVVSLSSIAPTCWYGGYLKIQAVVSPSVPIGTMVTFQSWLFTSTGEDSTANNRSVLDMTVVGSIDPNDKRALPEGKGVDKTILPTDRLTYRIDFENKAQATAEAIYILVIDTLDANLDWATLAEGASSHPEKCKLAFNSYTGVLTYFCDSIMLPPNVNPPEGEGYFTYSITPKTGLLNGTPISNRAHIRFDYNEFLAAPDSGPVVRTVSDCSCPHQGDIATRPAGDGVLDVFDVIDIIGIAFSGEPDPQDPGCLGTRGDVDNNGVTDVFDVIYLIATAFSGGPNPVDPCAP